MPNRRIGDEPFDAERVRISAQCRDCDLIPKIPSAGGIVRDGNQAYQMMHNGLKIPLGIYHGSWMAEIIRRLNGHHEPQEEKAFHRVLQEMPHGACMLELGAFWGYYSMWFQKSVPAATCYLIEPNAGKLAVCKRCFAVNKMTGLFSHAFVGNESNPNAVFKDWDGIPCPVSKISVDDYLAQRRISFLHIVHSDIQGGEFEMLMGARRSIEGNRIGYFFISTHSAKLHEACLAFLKDRLFHVVSAHTPAESYSEDGLIVARGPTLLGIDRVKVSKRRPPVGASLRGIAKRFLRSHENQACPRSLSIAHPAHPSSTLLETPPRAC